LRVQM